MEGKMETFDFLKEMKYADFLTAPFDERREVELKLLKKIPKADLHCHIGGILSAESQKAVGDVIWKNMSEDERKCSMEVERIKEMIKEGRSSDSRKSPWTEKWNDVLRLVTCGICHKKISRDSTECKFCDGQMPSPSALPPRSHLAAAILTSLTVEQLKNCLYPSVKYRWDDRFSLKGNMNFGGYARPGELMGSTLLSTSDNRAIEAYGEGIADHILKTGVRYLEIRMSPTKYREELNEQIGMVKQLKEGVEKGIRGSDCVVRYLFSLDRRQIEEKKIVRNFLRLLEQVATDDDLSPYVVGFDIAGEEEVNDIPDDVLAKFRTFRDDHPTLDVTCHAGETGGLSNMKAALSASAMRIGHGLNLRSSTARPHLERFAIDGRPCLEMCPTSNLVVVTNYKYPQLRPGDFEDIPPQPVDNSALVRWPLFDFLNNGVHVTICTDNPFIDRTNIWKEYIVASRLSGRNDEGDSKLTWKHILALVYYGFKHSFDTVKRDSMMKKVTKEIKGLIDGYIETQEQLSDSWPSNTQTDAGFEGMLDIPVEDSLELSELSYNDSTNVITLASSEEEYLAWFNTAAQRKPECRPLGKHPDLDKIKEIIRKRGESSTILISGDSGCGKSAQLRLLWGTQETELKPLKVWLTTGDQLVEARKDKKIWVHLNKELHRTPVPIIIDDVGVASRFLLEEHVDAILQLHRLELSMILITQPHTSLNNSQRMKQLIDFNTNLHLKDEDCSSMVEGLLNNFNNEVPTTSRELITEKLSKGLLTARQVENQLSSYQYKSDKPITTKEVESWRNDSELLANLLLKEPKEFIGKVMILHRLIADSNPDVSLRELPLEWFRDEVGEKFNFLGNGFVRHNRHGIEFISVTDDIWTDVALSGNVMKWLKGDHIDVGECRNKMPDPQVIEEGYEIMIGKLNERRKKIRSGEEINPTPAEVADALLQLDHEINESIRNHIDDESWGNVASIILDYLSPSKKRMDRVDGI